MKKLMSISSIVVCCMFLIACKGSQGKSNVVAPGTNVPGVGGDYESEQEAPGDESQYEDPYEDPNPFEGTVNGYSGSREVSTPKLPKPDLNRIKSDLVGHSISEGVTDGYHKKGWTYTIEFGQLQDVELLNNIVDNSDMYIAEISAIIKPNANYYYDAKMKIQYINTPQKGWMLDNVASLGLDIVSNGYYDDCISVERDNGSVYLYNNSESSLIVGGRYRNERYLYHFYDVIVGHGKEDYYAPKDFILDFVLKEY